MSERQNTTSKEAPAGTSATKFLVWGACIVVILGGIYFVVNDMVDRSSRAEDKEACDRTRQFVEAMRAVGSDDPTVDRAEYELRDCRSKGL